MQCSWHINVSGPTPHSFYRRYRIPPTSVQTQMLFIGPLKLLITRFCSTTEHMSMSKRLVIITRFRLMNATIFKHHETVQDNMRRRNLVGVDVHHGHATQA